MMSRPSSMLSTLKGQGWAVKADDRQRGDAAAGEIVGWRISITRKNHGWTFIAVRVDSSGQEHNELKKHPLISDLRGWEQRVEAGRARFRLAPVGKELAAPVKVDDPFAEFDGPPQ